MADYKLNISEFLNRSQTVSVIDVRSPAEFVRGHIHGAVNMPLFTNEERSIVGTLFFKKGSSDAMIKGLEIIGPKMKQFAEAGLKLAKGGEVLIYCWRGGLRSNSMAWLFQTIGIRTAILEGGYKTYRRFVQAFFNKPFILIVIGGMTGSGKTEILEVLEGNGHQVLHLERLASHKGSVFGGIGQPDQPTTEQFENLLFTELYHIDRNIPLFVEDESLAVGRVFIPRPLYQQMSSAYFICLTVPFSQRVKRLVQAYTGGERQSLIDGVKRIEKRLGIEKALQVIDCINSGSLNQAVEMVLHYYDKVYLRSMSLHKRKEVLEILVKEESPVEVADKIVSAIGNW
jgi:tRNA 2-selenouridine synthase